MEGLKMTLKNMLNVTCGETTLKIKAINKDCDSETINIMRLKSGFTANDASKRADEFTETIRKYGDFIVRSEEHTSELQSH